MAEAPCFTHKVKHGRDRGAIMAAVERAKPGDTVSIAPGFYMVRTRLSCLLVSTNPRAPLQQLSNEPQLLPTLSYCCTDYVLLRRMLART